MSNSIQHALLRIRPPRVNITYDVEIGNAIEKKELPFVVGVLSDLAFDSAGKLSSLKERNFIEIDRDNFNAVLSSIAPSVNLVIADKLTDGKAKKITLNFSNFDDFSPNKIAHQIPALDNLLNIRKGIVDLVAKLDGNELLVNKIAEIVEKNELREQIKADIENAEAPNIKKILEEVGMLKAEANFEFLTNLFTSLYKAIENIEAQHIEDTYSFLIKLVADIEKKISLQLDVVMHAEEFKKLEAAWRGLQYLVFNTETSTRLKIKVIPITKEEFGKDLEKAVEFDQSNLFKKIYESEYGTLGGAPYSCLVGDFAFGRSANDIKMIRNIATLAAASHAPFIAAVAPDMFDIGSFADLSNPRDLAKIFESSELAGWNSFRETEDSRYVNLVLPKILTRLPYSANSNPCEEFNYEETVDGADNSNFCWGNPAYALAERITNAFATYSWTAAIRGAEGGGKVDQLPAYTFKTKSGDIMLKCPCQTPITDRREKELSDLGFISLCHSKGTDYSVFFGAQSTQKAKKYNTAEATANAAISARLPYLLNASRFAHYVKMLMRDKIGSFMSAKEVEAYLQNWIADYVLLSDEGSQELKSQYPLREAKINVVDDPSSPGAYRAVMFLRPHFQLEELSVSLRLVAKLGGAA